MRWPQIRAGLIALAIAFGLIDGLPLPPRYATPAWERGFVEDVRSVQAVLIWPVHWLQPTLRIAQRWALYQSPLPLRWRLWLEGRRPDGRWTVLYRAGDPEHTEYAPIVENGRLRSAWDITDREPIQYGAFADWMMARILADHPEVTAARTRMEQVKLSSDGVAPTGQFAHIHIRERGAP